MFNQVEAPSMKDDTTHQEAETGIFLLYNGCTGSFNSDIVFFILYYGALRVAML